MKKIVFIVERTSDGFSAYAEDDDIRAYTSGDTIAELRQNIEDAYNSFAEIKGWPEVSIDQITVRYDIPQFFQFYKSISAKGLAARIGMDHTVLSRYVSGDRKPSPKQVERILTGIQNLGKELASLQLV